MVPQVRYWSLTTNTSAKIFCTFLQIFFMKRLLIPSALIALTLFACNQAEKPKTETSTAESFDLTAAKDSIIASNNRLTDAIAAGDSVAFAALYLSDAKVMPSNRPALSGTAAITSFASELYKMGTKNVKFETVNISGGKDLIVEEGISTFFDDKGAVVNKGKYLRVWKQEDGKWKLFRNIFNSDLPIAPSMPSERKR